MPHSAMVKKNVLACSASVTHTLAPAFVYTAALRRGDNVGMRHVHSGQGESAVGAGRLR